MDVRSGLIRRAVLTPAHVNESEVADTLISGDERAVYADKAYESKARRARLQAQGINDRIMHRSHKHQRGLPYWQQRRNALIGKVRAPVSVWDKRGTDSGSELGAVGRDRLGDR